MRASWVVVLCVVVLFVGASAVVPARAAASADSETFVLGAVGDIAGDHLPDPNGQRNHMDHVADLALSLNLKYFLLLGDEQHNFGTYEEYMDFYDPGFGQRVNGISYPVPGNHDYYKSATAEGFFTYFHDRLHALVQAHLISTDAPGLDLGYYSFNLGAWHIVALNSQLAAPKMASEASWNSMYFGPGTPEYEAQMAWLRSDLSVYARGPQTGLLAYWHHPITYNSWVRPLWDLLYAYGADIVLGGHDHNYQRWAPMNPAQAADSRGIREFVVGTGGYYDNPITFLNGNGYTNGQGHEGAPPLFQFGQDTAFGLLQLTLRKGSYDFAYYSIEGTVLDAGTQVPVHGSPNG